MNEVMAAWTQLAAETKVVKVKRIGCYGCPPRAWLEPKSNDPHLLDGLCVG